MNDNGTKPNLKKWFINYKSHNILVTIWWRWRERVRKSPRFSWRRIVSKMETRVTENEMVELVRFWFLDGFGHCLSAVRHEVALGQKIVEIDSIILRIVIMNIVASALCCVISFHY